MTTLSNATTTVNLASYSSGNPFYVGPTTTIITTSGNGIYGDGSQDWTLTNMGTIDATASGSFGIFLKAGGDITNSGTTALIEGYTGIQVTAAAGTIGNAGTIDGTGGYAVGIDLGLGGSVSNTTTGAVIEGGRFAIEINGAAGTVTNAGTVESRRSIVGGSVALGAGGTVTNSGTASVIEGYTGVEIFGGAGIVTNAGTINAAATGVYVGPNSTVTNLGTASLITAGLWGVEVSVGSGTVLNQGTIVSGRGVYFQQGGTITNSGTIETTGTAGIGIKFGTSGFITNAGTIMGATAGVELGGGSVTNSGVIAATAGNAIGVQFAGSIGETLVNAGTILGHGTGDAILFGAGNDLLEIDPGAVFSGKVDGEAGTNTLELLHGATTGKVSGFGTAMIGFQIVDVSQSASWILSGSTKIGAGVAVNDSGSFALTGTSTLIGSIGGGGILEFDGGKAAIDGGAKLTVAHWDLVGDAAVGVAETLAFAGSLADGTGSTLTLGANHILDLTGPVSGGGAIAIDAGASLETGGAVAAALNIAFTAATGTLKIGDTAGFAAAIRGLAAGDRIDLASANFAYSTKETLAFKENTAGTEGILTVTDGTHSLSLTLFGQYMAAGFHLSNDGHGDTLVTYTPPSAAKTLLAGHG